MNPNIGAAARVRVRLPRLSVDPIPLCPVVLPSPRVGVVGHRRSGRGQASRVVGIGPWDAPGVTTDVRRDHPVASAVRAAAKVPEITVFFWVTKVLTTGMGEAASDYLGRVLGSLLAISLAGAALVAALVVQLSVRRYVAGIYWLAVVMVSVFGTMVADGLHNGAGVPYLVSTLFFGVALAGVFGAWYFVEGTLSVHDIYTRRRELFYWTTVVATFALGTSSGDMGASTLRLGYLASSGVFLTMIVASAVGYLRFRLNAIIAFWFAYILTRPLGASFADWMAVPRKQGGLGFGTGFVTLGMTVVIIGFVGYLALVSRRGTGPMTAPRSAPPNSTDAAERSFSQRTAVGRSHCEEADS